MSVNTCEKKGQDLKFCLHSPPHCGQPNLTAHTIARGLSINFEEKYCAIAKLYSH